MSAKRTAAGGREPEPDRLPSRCRPALLAVVMAAGAALAAAQPFPPCYRAAECATRVGLPDGGRIPVYASHPLGGPNRDPEWGLVVIHGMSRTAENYYRYALAAVERPLPGEQMGRRCLNDVTVLVPHFQLQGDAGVEDGDVRWRKDGARAWPEGGDSRGLGAARISSFAVIDELLRRLEASFPALQRIVLAGHSAGGQLVNRYAAAGRGPDEVAVDSRFVVLNPSSYLYIDEARPLYDSQGLIGFERYQAECLCGRDCCDGYDDYKYGLGGDLNPYVSATGVKAIIDHLEDRWQHYFVGELDFRRGGSMDCRCPADAQGQNRRDRGVLYHQYIQRFAEWQNNATFEIVPGVAHSGSGMLCSEEVAAVLLPPPTGSPGLAGFNLCRHQDRALAIDHDGTAGEGEGVFLFRPGLGAVAVQRWDVAAGTFVSDYLAGGLTDRAAGRCPERPEGIGGYPLSDPFDHATVLDFDGDGDDDLFLYRPGLGAFGVIESTGLAAGPFAGLLVRPKGGLLGFDLLDGRDRAIAFDHDGDGREALLLVRPGAGGAAVVEWFQGDLFERVHPRDGGPLEGRGIGGYDLASAADRALAFDYDGDGDDDLFLHRPGEGAAAVVRWLPELGRFDDLFIHPDGLGGFDLASPADRAVAFDHDGDGDDALFLYRPGAGGAGVFQWLKEDLFERVYPRDRGPLAGGGIAGYDLADPADRALAFDHDGDCDDELLLYRPGRGAAGVVEWSRERGTFRTLHLSPDGLGGFDLASPLDRVLALDADGIDDPDWTPPPNAPPGCGKDELLFYRPGRGIAWVVRARLGAGGPVFEAVPHSW